MDPITFADHRCLLQFQCPAGYLVWLMPLVTITFYHCARGISHSSSTVKMQPIFAHCNKCEIWNSFSQNYHQSKFLTKNSGKIVYFVHSISMLVKSSIMSRLVIILVCPIFHSFAFLHWNVEIKRWSDLNELDGLLTRYDLTGIGIIWYALISCLTAIDLFWHYGWFIKRIALANFHKFNDKSW